VSKLTGRKYRYKGELVDGQIPPAAQQLLVEEDVRYYREVTLPRKKKKQANIAKLRAEIEQEAKEPPSTGNALADAQRAIGKALRSAGSAVAQSDVMRMVDAVRGVVVDPQGQVLRAAGEGLEAVGAKGVGGTLRKAGEIATSLNPAARITKEAKKAGLGSLVVPSEFVKSQFDSVAQMAEDPEQALYESYGAAFDPKADPVARIMAVVNIGSALAGAGAAARGVTGAVKAGVRGTAVAGAIGAKGATAGLRARAAMRAVEDKAKGKTFAERVADLRKTTGMEEDAATAALRKIDDVTGSMPGYVQKHWRNKTTAALKDLDGRIAEAKKTGAAYDGMVRDKRALRQSLSSGTPNPGIVKKIEAEYGGAAPAAIPVPAPVAASPSAIPSAPAVPPDVTPVTVTPEAVTPAAVAPTKLPGLPDAQPLPVERKMPPVDMDGLTPDEVAVAKKIEADPTVTGGSRAYFQRMLKLDVPPPGRQAWSDVIDDVVSRKMYTQEGAAEIMDRAARSEYALLTERDVIALDFRLHSINQTLDSLDEASDAYRTLNLERERIVQTLSVAGTNTARALASRGVAVGDDFSYHGILSRFGIMARNKLTPEQKAELRVLSRELKAAERELEDARVKAKDDAEEAVVGRVREELDARAKGTRSSVDTSRASVKREKSVKAIADAKARLAALKAQPKKGVKGKEAGALDFGTGPEQMKLYGVIIRERIRLMVIDGVENITLAVLRKRLQKDDADIFAKLTDKELQDILVAKETRKPTPPSPVAVSANKELAGLKKQVEDLRAKQNPTTEDRRAFQKATARIKVLESEQKQTPKVRKVEAESQLDAMQKEAKATGARASSVRAARSKPPTSKKAGEKPATDPVKEQTRMLTALLRRKRDVEKKIADAMAGRETVKQPKPSNPEIDAVRKDIDDLNRKLAEERLEKLLRDAEAGRLTPKPRKAQTTAEFEAGLKLSSLRAKLQEKVLQAEAEAQYDALNPFMKGTVQVFDILNAPRTLQAMGDISAVGAQGAELIRTLKFDVVAKGVRDMARSRTSAGFNRVQFELESDPIYNLARGAGVSFSRTGLLGEGERPLHNRLFMTKLIENSPGVSAWKRWSERSFNAYLNRTRLETFKSFHASAVRFQGGKSLNKDELQLLADVTNVLSGKGKVEQAEALNHVMYAAQFFSASVQMSAPLTATSKALVRKTLKNKEIGEGTMKAAALYDARRVGASAITLAMLGYAANMMGGDVVTDIRDKDFGFARFPLPGGKYFAVDWTLNLAPYWRLYAQMLTQEPPRISEPGKGERYGPLKLFTRSKFEEKEPRDPERYYVPPADFVSNKLSPTAQKALAVTVNKADVNRFVPGDQSGARVPVVGPYPLSPSTLMEEPFPLFAQSAYRAVDDKNPTNPVLAVAALLVGAFSFVGIRADIKDYKPPKEREADKKAGRTDTQRIGQAKMREYPFDLVKAAQNIRYQYNVPGDKPMTPKKKPKPAKDVLDGLTFGPEVKLPKL
jgi:hypothetical protein